MHVHGYNLQLVQVNVVVFLVDTTGLPNPDSNFVAISSFSSSSSVSITSSFDGDPPFSPTSLPSSTSPFSPTISSPPTHNNPDSFPFFDEHYKLIQQQQQQDKKKLEELENTIAQSNDTIEELKSKILSLEAAYGNQKEERAKDKEKWSSQLQEKEKELRKSQSMERTLAGMETYVDIQRLRGLAGMMFCCTDLDLDF